jgi:hypothetical protein
MKLPTFKPSKQFLGEIDLACLVAKIKNSKLAGVAARYIAESKDDRTCEMYLRGKNPKKISEWQQEMLEQLFVKEELASAIEQAMKEYGKNPDAYCGCTEEEQSEIKKYGIAPFVWLSVIVIDEIKKEVIFSGGCERAFHIAEHGLSIYLHKGRWRWDEAEYFDSYRSDFEENHPPTSPEFAAARSKVMNEMVEELHALFSEPEASERRWKEIFPMPTGGTMVETDPSFLYGDWKFDARKTAQVLKQMGEKKSIVECKSDWGDNFYRISQETVKLFQCDYEGDCEDGELCEHFICGCQRCGNRVIIRYKEGWSEKVLTDDYWCDGERLVDHTGLAYRRVK